MRSNSRWSISSVTGVIQTVDSAADWLRYVRTLLSRTADGTASSKGFVTPI